MNIPKWLVVVAVAFAWACKRENPDFCCVNEAQCSRLGVDGVRACKEPGQTCKDNECVGFECLSSAECGGATPICTDHVCVAACTQNSDCDGIADRPYCDSDGTCVGCISGLQCMGEEPICDTEDRSCRGCSLDNECGLGVCNEARGTCEDATSLIYVSGTGQDVGACDSAAAACRTIQYAQGLVSAQRHVIRVLGSVYSLGGATVALNGVILDAMGTTLVGNALPLLTVSGSATINGVRLTSSTFANDVLIVNPGGVLAMASSTLDSAGIYVDRGTATFSKMVVTNGTIECNTGMASIRSSNFARSSFKPSSCRFEVTSSKFDLEGDSGRPIFGDGRFTIENNIIIGNAPSTPVQIFGADPGSTFRFNTIINTTPQNTGAGIVCPDGLDVTSNIFAVNSPNPITPCVARYSLFDGAGASAAAAGSNNVVGEGALFFKNAAIGDYHLNVGSPALDKGQPGLVTTDFDGNPRGAAPDIGAYEAP